jgi:hypothetical protein
MRFAWYWFQESTVRACALDRLDDVVVLDLRHREKCRDQRDDDRDGVVEAVVAGGWRRFGGVWHRGIGPASHNSSCVHAVEPAPPAIHRFQIMPAWQVRIFENSP